MSRIITLSTSMAALLVGLTVANAQTQAPGGGAQIEQRQDGGGDGQQGKQERRGGSQDDSSSKQRQGGSSDGQADTKQRTTSDDTKQERKAQGDTKEQTGQGAERKAQGQDGESKDRKAQGQDAGGKEQRASRDSADSPKKRPQAKITQKEKTVIRERVIQRAPKRYTRNEVNFNITVGTSVPDTYVIYDMPTAIIELVPEYQGYDYIVVGDVLLIIDPDTREIVDVVQV
jgi:hypothetical protein